MGADNAANLLPSEHTEEELSVRSKLPSTSVENVMFVLSKDKLFYHQGKMILINIPIQKYNKLFRPYVIDTQPKS